MALRTREVQNQAEIRAFFDGLAPHYRDCHGPADQLLRQRLRLIRALLHPCQSGLLVEIGCGTGMHLFALAGDFQQSWGVDLSPNMIAEAERLRPAHPFAGRIRFRVDAAETLRTVSDRQTDAVICVGALEHMPDKPAVLRQVARILKPGGVFVCLTPDAGYLWYTRIAPRLGLATQHLSTDRLLRRDELRALLRQAGLCPVRLAHWDFIPRGDMPRTWGALLAGLAFGGKLLRMGHLRGGLYCRAERADHLGADDA